MTERLGVGLDAFDLRFLGEPNIIATGLLTGRDGVALVDPGPSTTIATLRSELAVRGAGPADVRAILLTHIHLDHAGATGTLVRDCPAATVFVHEAGAPHLAHPAKLIASATRLYGPDMERLWGEILPVPADRIGTVGDERVTIVGHTVLPATPPPDVDLEAWRASTERILAWHPDVLFLTHFGPHRSPRVHFSDFWARMDEWNRRVRAQLQQPGDDAARARAFSDDVMTAIARATSRDEAQAYAQAGRFDFSWAGLARYWRRRATS
jgi:glyoxylase-like metal-dependent hydrolase (beta-lactamase superfamily II)